MEDPKYVNSVAEAPPIRRHVRASRGDYTSVHLDPQRCRAGLTHPAIFRAHKRCKTGDPRLRRAGSLVSAMLDSPPRAALPTWLVWSDLRYPEGIESPLALADRLLL